MKHVLMCKHAILLSTANAVAVEQSYSKLKIIAEAEGLPEYEIEPSAFITDDIEYMVLSLYAVFEDEQEHTLWALTR